MSEEHNNSKVKQKRYVLIRKIIQAVYYLKFVSYFYQAWLCFALFLFIPSCRDILNRYRKGGVVYERIRD